MDDTRVTQAGAGFVGDDPGASTAGEPSVRDVLDAREYPFFAPST